MTKTIKGYFLQKEITRIQNQEPYLPDFMRVTGYSHSNFTIEDDGTVRDPDEMAFFTVNPNLSLPQLTTEIAKAIINISL